MTRINAVPSPLKPPRLRLSPAAAAMRMALIAFAASVPLSAIAAPGQNDVPAGFNPQSGNVNAPTTQNHVMTILQNSGFALIDWTTFNIGSNAGVVFQQPTAAAVVLNRVTGVGRSEIFGSLTANGTVGVFNSAGVLFGPGSSVNVAGLIASSLNLDSAANDGVAVTFDLDFNGAAADGAVINRGDITTGAGGVTFIGRNVLNEGTLTVGGGGTAALTGAEAASVRLPKDAGNPREVQVSNAGTITALTSGGAAGVKNTGTITAHDIALSASIAPGLLDHVVNNSGLLVASGVNVNGLQGGGAVQLVAEGAGVDTAGGTVTTLGFGAAQDGTIEVDTDGDAKLGALNAGDTGTVSIDAGGAVIDGNDAAVNVTADDLTLRAGKKIALDTHVAHLDARSTGGRLEIDEADGLASADLRTHDGRIELTAGGTIDQLSITSITGSGGGGASVVTSAGDIVVDKIKMGDQLADIETVRLEATNGAILDDVQDDKLDIGSGRVVLVAGNGIGTSAAGPLDLVGHVDLTVTGAGDIDVRGVAFFGMSAETANGSINVDAGTLYADNIVSQSGADGNDITLHANSNLSIGNVDAGAAGDVRLVARDSILEIANHTTDITGDRVVLRAGRDILAQSGDGRIETQANELLVTGGANTHDVRIGEVDDVRFGFSGAAAVDLRAGGSIEVAAIDNADHATTLRAGGAITDGNGGATNVSGTALDARAENGIDLDTDVDFITARATGAGDIALDEANAVTLDVTAEDGAIDLSAGGVATLESVRAKGGSDDDDIRVNAQGIVLDPGAGRPAVGAAGAGDVRLVANLDRVIDGQDAGADGVDVRGDAVTITSAAGIGTGGNGTLETDATHLRLAVTGAGSIDVAETGNVVLVSATTGGDGDINVRASGDLTARTVASQSSPLGNDIVLRAGGNLVADDVSGGGITLRAGNDLDAGTLSGNSIALRAGNDLDAGTLTGTGVTLRAGADASADSITSVGAVLARAGGDLTTGSIAADVVDARAGATFTTGTVVGDTVVDLRAGGDLVAGAISGTDMALIANGAIKDGNAGATNVTADTVTLRSGTGINLDTDIVVVDARATAGNINLSDAGDLQLTRVAASAGDVHVSAAGFIAADKVRGSNVSLDAGGAIFDVNGGETNVVAPGALTVSAGNGGIDLDTNVASVEAHATGPGDVDLENAGALVVSDLTAADGAVSVLAHGALDAQRVVAADHAVSLRSAGADLTAGRIQGGDVKLVADGAIVDGNGNATNVSGGSLTARSATGVDLDTNVDRVTARVSGPGAITLDERNNVTLTNVATADGAIRVDAGGTLALGTVKASGGDGDVHLGSSGGAIVDDVNDDVVDVAAGALELTAANGIGNATTGTVDTRVTTLTLATTNRGIAIDQAGALTLTGVTATNGNIDVSATGQLTADAVSASGNVALASGADSNLLAGAISGQEVRLTAGRNIVDTNGTATNVSGGTLVASAGRGIDLDTSVDSIRAASTGTGAITLDEADAVTLDRVATHRGPVTVTSGGTLTARHVSSGGGNGITLAATAGNLVAGDIDARQANVTLTADTVDGQQVLDDGRTGTLVRANTLDVTARSGIGAAGALGTDVATLRADAGTGPLSIREVDGLALERAVTDGNLSVHAGGDLVAGDVNAGTGDLTLISSGGSIADDGVDTTRVTGGALTAQAIGDVALDTRVKRVTATSREGDVRIGDQGGNLEVALVRGDVVDLGASGALLGVAGSDPNVRGTSLIARSGGRMNLTTEVDTISAQATGPGSIVLSDASGVELTDVSAADGGVAVSAGGSLSTGTVAGDTIRLTSGGAITDANGTGTINTTGGTLVATAVNGIDLDTEVDTIRQATTVNGIVTIREATSAAIGTVQASTVNLTAGGGFTDANGDTVNVVADTLVARAADGIDLDTRIDTLDAVVSGSGDLDIADFNALTVQDARTDGGDIRIATGNEGGLLILNLGQIDAGSGDVTLDVRGGVRQEGRRPDASIVGGSLTIQAGGNVGQLLAPLFVNIGGPVTITFDSDRPVALITGFFGSLNEGGQVFGLAQNTELSNSVGAIQSSFQKTVTFNLDSSQFATQTRIYTTEGTGILLPEEVRE